MPGTLTRRDLIDRVRLIGYGVVEVDGEEPEDAERAARQAEIASSGRASSSAIFTIPLFVLSMARDFGLVGMGARAGSTT